MTEEKSLSNKDFWDELCGSNLFVHLGLKEMNEQNLKIFDEHYFAMYPYLKNYVSKRQIENRSVLEIGLGFGTLSEYIFSNSKQYTGVDYASNPVKIVNERAKNNGRSQMAYAVQGDARDLKFDNETFDTVVSIGCLHHTGDTAGSVNEVFRVLKKGGSAIIMLYNKNSFRQKFVNPFRYFLAKRRKKYRSYEEYTRASYDANLAGDAAPIVDTYTKKEINQLFKQFKSVKIYPENFDNHVITLFGKNKELNRELFLNNIAKVMGLDLYIVATK
jgi:ubiquinone/menaquinone biosynthesis C-methylase UbiE